MHLGNPRLSQDPDAWQYASIEGSVGSGKGLKRKFVNRESIIMSAAIEKEFALSANAQLDDDW